MRLLLRLLCLLYGVGLTIVLLAPDPKALLGFQSVPSLFGNDRGTHFLLFAGLAGLALASEWPRRASFWFLAVLAAYALASETLQAWCPPRTVELLDYIENLLGIGAIWLIYSAAQCRFARRTALSRSAPTRQPPQPAQNTSGSCGSRSAL